MRLGEILNPALAAAVAELGHGDLFMVVDAGFPIPRSTCRVDLAVDAGIPSIQQVVALLLRHVFVERVSPSEEMRSNNPAHFAAIVEQFRGSGAALDVVAHSRLIQDAAKSAKLIVRTGDFVAWGSISMVASTEPQAWFTDAAIAGGLVMPDDYRTRIARIEAKDLPR
jgi:simple sugar transport system permease protein/D-ribose pyranase